MRATGSSGLLVLGSNAGAAEIVARARRRGARTGVTDYLPVSDSPAKRVADESFQVSTADADGLSELLVRGGFGAVLAGISEFNLTRALDLAERHGLPFYCTRAQWDAIQTKDRFADLCAQAGVDRPRRFPSGSEPAAADFPVVVKPVDASSGEGVFVCADAAALSRHAGAARAASPSGRIVVEEFVAGQEFTAHYTVAAGRVALSAIDQRIPVRVTEAATTTVPVARIYPAVFAQAYAERADPAVRGLIAGLGLDHAVVFVQGIHDPATGRFAIFEAGLRPAAECVFRFLEPVNGVDPLDLLVAQALGQEPRYPLEREDPFLGGRIAAVVSFVTRGGTLGAIRGLDAAVAATGSVVAVEQRYPVGAVTPRGDTLRQLLLRFTLVAGSRAELARDVAALNAAVDVVDDAGRELVIKPDPAAFPR
jgi:biotin carboxylase